jgi:ABC-type antimicrobial peptide transport system permease subunit
MASTVAQRTSEIGVRMALGAQRGDVLRMVALQGARLIAIGLAGGIIGALLLARVISSLLFGIGANDPLTLAAACLVLGLAAFGACMLSAFRATRIDPIHALRGT